MLKGQQGLTGLARKHGGERVDPLLNQKMGLQDELVIRRVVGLPACFCEGFEVQEERGRRARAEQGEPPAGIMMRWNHGS